MGFFINADDEPADDTNEDSAAPKEWDDLVEAGVVSNEVAFEDFVDTDAAILTRETLNENDILEQALAKKEGRNCDEENEEESNDEEDPPTLPTLNEAMSMVNQLRRLLQSRGCDISKVKSVDEVENAIIEISKNAPARQLTIIECLNK